MRKAAPGVRKTDGDRPKTPAAAAPNAATKDGAPRPIRIQIPAPAVARNQVQSPCSPTLVSKPPAASTTTRTVNGISKSPAPASTPSSPPSSQPPTPPPKDSPIHKAARTTADPATIHVNPTTESNTLQPLPSPPSPTATKLPPSAITIRPPKRMSSYMSLHLAAALSATNTTPHKFTPSLKSPISPPPALILTHESDDTESDDSEEDSDTSTTSSDPDTSNLKFVSSPQQQRQQHQAVPTSPVSPTAPKRFSSFNAGALVEQLRRQKEMGQAQAQAVAAY
ncbi:hypothetical protein HK102_007995 [Quaeritorhiza haematococci]|nr:hypothetical protein HK102_007995 [Quaeritorhiza haematococci]